MVIVGIILYAVILLITFFVGFAYGVLHEEEKEENRHYED